MSMRRMLASLVYCVLSSHASRKTQTMAPAEAAATKTVPSGFHPDLPCMCQSLACNQPLWMTEFAPSLGSAGRCRQLAPRPGARQRRGVLDGPWARRR
jgi:hypothetical protein